MLQLRGVLKKGQAVLDTMSGNWLHYVEWEKGVSNVGEGSGHFTRRRLKEECGERGTVLCWKHVARCEKSESDPNIWNLKTVFWIVFHMCCMMSSVEAGWWHAKKGKRLQAQS